LSGGFPPSPKQTCEDGTRQIFKITTDSVDLKPDVGHAVKLIGHKASGALSASDSDNSFAVTQLNMIGTVCRGVRRGRLLLKPVGPTLSPELPMAALSRPMFYILLIVI
jgi:hypothetical protein